MPRCLLVQHVDEHVVEPRLDLLPVQRGPSPACRSRRAARRGPCRRYAARAEHRSGLHAGSAAQPAHRLFDAVAGRLERHQARRAHHLVGRALHDQPCRRRDTPRAGSVPPRPCSAWTPARSCRPPPSRGSCPRTRAVPWHPRRRSVRRAAAGAAGAARRRRAPGAASSRPTVPAPIGRHDRRQADALRAPRRWPGRGRGI